MGRWQSESDEEDDSDPWDEEEGDQLIACPHCRREVYADAERCPYCEQYLTDEEESTGRPWWIVVVVVLLLIAMVLAIAEVG